VLRDRRSFLLLTLTAGGRHYGFAGLVMALFGLTIVLVSPFRAWMADRYGPRRALPGADAPTQRPPYEDRTPWRHDSR
jgi:MFS family permease